MFCLTVDVPEDFHSAIIHSQAKKVCDKDAATASALFGRGIARMMVGRQDDARADFLAAQPELGDACSIEIAYLRLREHGTAQDIARELQSIATRAEAGSRVAARAWHVLGRSQERLSNFESAVDALHRAAEIYRELGESLGVAHVYNSHGQLESARGRHDIAAQYFALSLVEKSLVGDRYGMAITLGELGRANLDAGRIRDAINCFQSDLVISRQIGERRGIAKMHGDLGRAFSLSDEYSTAEEHLQRCLSLCKKGHFRGLEFFAWKDLARNYVRSGALDQAEDALRSAKQSLPPSPETYLQSMLSECFGELWMERGNLNDAIDSLSSAVDGYEHDNLPDQEIRARISLARALARAGHLARAEQCLCRGLRFTRMEGYARYVRDLREEITRLGVVESALEETDRQLDDCDSSTGSSYIKLNRLGSGAFGEVFRVFDSWRGGVFALKILHLEELYDVRQREKLITSAKTEILAASRVRHPGVVRVHKIGDFPNGQTYVVQDYVEGKPLSDLIANGSVTDMGQVFGSVAKVADALQALHDAGIVHRDLKPSNIILRPGHGPVLIDFGIAHVPIRAASSEGRISGTFGYMAPEQALGSRADSRADIYSLGALAYQWLAGVLPLRLRGSTIEELVRDLNDRDPTPLSSFRPNIDPAAEKLVMSMLEKRPGRRPSPASEIANEMREMIKTLCSQAAPLEDTCDF